MKARSNDHGPHPKIDDLILLEPRTYFRKVSLARRLLDNFRGLQVTPHTYERPSLLVAAFGLFRVAMEHQAPQILRGVSRTAPSDRSIKETFSYIAGVRGSAFEVAQHCVNPSKFAEFASLCNQLERGMATRGAVDPYRVRMRDSHSTGARDSAQKSCSRLIELGAKFAIHLSDADLTDLSPYYLDTLGNILWTSNTLWPVDMEEEIHRLSIEARPGYLFLPPRIPIE